MMGLVVDRLRVALLGLTGVGAEYLAIIRSDERFELVAVADRDSEQVRSCSEQLQVRGFDDCRSLVVECAHSGLDALFVALEPFESIGFVEMAAERGVGVFHKAPVARNVREMDRLIQRFGRNQHPLVVSRPWLFKGGLSTLGRVDECAGRIYAATATVRTTDLPVGWRGDSLRAGGGVLLNGAYEAVDILVHLLGLPEAVYAQHTTHPRSGSQGRHDTEDVAIVSLSFGEGQVGCVTACRGARRSFWEVTLVGTRGSLDVGESGLVITPGQSACPESDNVESDHPARSAIGAFGASYTSSDVPFESTVEEHLSTVATIESAYLSAKTGSPESPARLLS